MASSAAPTPNPRPQRTALTRLLDAIEWAGNKLPDPAILFLIALAIVWGLSWPMSYVEYGDVDPRSEAKETERLLKVRQEIGVATVGLLGSPSGPVAAFTAVAGVSTPQKAPEQIQVRNLLTGEQLVTFLTRMVTEFTSFAPLGIVLVALLGVGVAEHTGFINALLKGLLSITPQQMLTPMVLLVAILSHSAGDTGYVVVIPLAGIMFAASGRHPLAGIVCGFAGVSGGFSATFIPSTLDPLLQGFTQTAANIIEPGRTVNPLCNWFFMSASSVLILVVGWVLTDRVIEPKLRATAVDGDPADMPALHPLSPQERRGMLAGLATFAALVLLLVAACVPSNSPFLLPDPANRMTHFERLTDHNAPIMRSIVPLIFLFFLVPGIVHGYVAGTVNNHRDIIKGMSKSMSTMGYYLVLVFFAAQFIYGFNASNLGVLLAIKGANFLNYLKDLGMPDQVTILGIILITTSVNLLIGSASAKWAMLGPIFVPMLMRAGFPPELTQGAYRIGDSSTNIITPLMPYFPLIVVYAQRYVKGTGIGTIMSLMIPYSLCFLTTWTLLLMVFWWLRLPLGLPLDIPYYPVR